MSGLSDRSSPGCYLNPDISDRIEGAELHADMDGGEVRIALARQGLAVVRFDDLPPVPPTIEKTVQRTRRIVANYVPPSKSDTGA